MSEAVVNLSDGIGLFETAGVVATSISKSKGIVLNMSDSIGQITATASCSCG
ncbi:hypothetical protein [Bacteroides stercorirosoris]|uniref:hypothetical protein n=1 Tax=Bacteroides stercorirosoris TaxID=871324 RepID=UPI00216B6733|nr:hypothetical protein [Bacteroides stercorirosoris]